jgi:hypothetical protein
MMSSAPTMAIRGPEIDAVCKQFANARLGPIDSSVICTAGFSRRWFVNHFA